jgi:hypothetical protein
MKIEIEDMTKGQLEEAMLLTRNDITQKLKQMQSASEFITHLNALFAEYETRFPVD